MGRCEFEICLNPAFVSEPLVTVLGAVRNHGYSIVFTLQQLLALSLMSAFSWSHWRLGVGAAPEPTRESCTLLCYTPITLLLLLVLEF